MARDEAYQEAEQRIEEARREGAVELDLSDMGLTEVPEAIASLTQLQQLDLSENQLTELPEAIASLTQLQQLNLSFNQLTELPEVIASLTQLQQLDLSENQLTELPEAIASLTQLQQLDLSENQLTELPESLRHLSKLSRLNLFNNKLQFMHYWIGELHSLNELAIGGNEFINLPDSLNSLGYCENLTWLDLGDSGGIGISLKRLPTCIRRLRKLTYLVAGFCELESIPNWIGELTSLEGLELYNNQLTDLQYRCQKKSMKREGAL